MNARVEVLHTGTVIVDEALPYFRPSNPPLAWTHAFRSRKKLVSVPVSCYLIESAHGLILLDTGWNSINRTRRGQIANLRHQYPVNKAELPAGQAVDEQLEERGIRLTDLDFVLLSHLHCDHADGLRLVRHAPRILTSATELTAASKDRIRYLPHEWSGVDLQTFTWNGRVGPAQRSWDIYGDGSVVMVNTPGHSWGLCATLVRGDDAVDSDFDSHSALGTDPRKTIVLASDVGYGQPSLNEGLRPSLVVDAAAATRCLNWVRDTSHDPRVAAVIANHDPTITPGNVAF